MSQLIGAPWYTFPMAISLAPSWAFIRSNWQAGNYWIAIEKLNNRSPQLVLHCIANETYYEDRQEVLFQENGWQFTGPNAIPTWFREPFHFLAGFAITMIFFAWPPVCFIASICIAIWKAWGEFVGDAQGQPDLKNVVDWSFWLMGTLSATIPSFLLFGTYPYK